MSALTEKSESPPESPLLCEINNGIARLTLNRPAQYNALSEQLLTLLSETLTKLGGDNSVKVVILGAAGNAFCAGHDLKQMRQNPSREYQHNLFTQCSAVMKMLLKLPQPVIAKVHGIATAAGCQLVASCDLAIAAAAAKFAVSGVRVGLFCSTPAVALSRNIGRKRAMEMLLTGDFIDAKTALQYGLINQVVAADELDAAADSIAEKISRYPKPVIQMGKRRFYHQLDCDIDSAYAAATDTMADNMMLEYAREGIDAFIEKRKPNWTDIK